MQTTFGVVRSAKQEKARMRGKDRPAPMPLHQNLGKILAKIPVLHSRRPS